MTRRYIIWIGLVSITAAVVLNTSLQTRQQQDRLAQINLEIKTEQERTRVLVAEWHSLKTPERLEALARRHLQGYDTIKPMQLAGLSDVPDRLPDAAPPVAVATAAPVTPTAEVAEAPVTTARPATTQVASITPPRARPAARPAAASAPAAEKQDDLARLIAESEAPAARASPPATRPSARADDGIRTIIERQQPSNGVVFASAR